MDASAVPNFDGKIVMLLLLNRSTDVTNLLRDVRFEMQGGRLFMIGNVLPHPDQTGPFDNVINGVAWEEVAEYMVFDSVADLAKRVPGPRKRKWL